jgi:hypothetical protein
MKQNEQELLIEINHLYNGLLEESDGYNYKRIVNTLSDKVFELYREFSPDYVSFDTVSSLSHTCGKEVSYVISSYTNSTRNNSSKRSKEIFIDFRDEVNRQIRIDLIHLFQIIKEIKEN